MCLTPDVGEILVRAFWNAGDLIVAIKRIPKIKFSLGKDASSLWKTIDWRLYTFLGHPHKMFRFPSPSLSWRWVGRSGKKKIKKNEHMIAF